MPANPGYFHQIHGRHFSGTLTPGAEGPDFIAHPNHRLHIDFAFGRLKVMIFAPWLGQTQITVCSLSQGK